MGRLDGYLDAYQRYEERHMKYTYIELHIMCIASSPQVMKCDHPATDIKWLTSDRDLVMLTLTR